MFGFFLFVCLFKRMCEWALEEPGGSFGVLWFLKQLLGGLHLLVLVWFRRVLALPAKGKSSFWSDTSILGCSPTRIHGDLGKAPGKAMLSRAFASLLVRPPKSTRGRRSHRLIALGLRQTPFTSLWLYVSGWVLSSSVPPPPARPLEPTSNCPDGNNGGAGLAGKEGGGENCLAPWPPPPYLLELGLGRGGGGDTHPELSSQAGKWGGERRETLMAILCKPQPS